MFNDMFGSFSAGSIGRLRFIGLTILLAVILMATALSLGIFAGVIHHVFPGERVTAAVPVLGFGAFAIMGTVAIAVTIGMLNLVAKRARDIGWSPVLLVILYVVFSGIVWIVLAIVPGMSGNPGAADTV